MQLKSRFNTDKQTVVNTQTNTQLAAATSQVCPWFSSLAYGLGRNLVLPLFFRQIRITGQENIPTNGPVILAPTHRSRWDALLVAYAAGRCVTGRDLRFMVTISEFQGLQGWLVQRMGGFPVDPKRPSITTLRHGMELLHEQESLVIFPEGGIFRDGNVHSLKPGVARLALSAESNHLGLGVKILPIGINYSQPYPNWGTDVSINIGSTIEVANYANGCVKQDAKKMTGDLAKALQNLSHHESEITTHAFVQVPNS
ncbi:MAG: 1-acyl-sn-glycerol-3-phosphate acyltransferase [Nostocaceae cyanobacterium]|nr:1-acyl-sn-glycerol-3-phosphate acyltransferase [Nostocaceae cyanobacterium]